MEIPFCAKLIKKGRLVILIVSTAFIYELTASKIRFASSVLCDISKNARFNGVVCLLSTQTKNTIVCHKNLIKSRPYQATSLPVLWGVGKTSTILQLLKTKPAQERWAVLVNEFGEIGIDGSVFESQHSEQHGVYIREVPGGCMCCTAGVPMQVELAQLLRRAKPDRLLIEPTGLGHPTEVLQTFNGQTFKDALDIQNVITVVDARQLSDKRSDSRPYRT